MKRYCLVSLVLLVHSTTLFGQDLKENFDPLQAEGIIPQDFIELSSEKFYRDRENISQDQSKKNRKTEEQFLLETNFGIDKLLLSGLVLFNDPLTDYVNAVADEVLHDNPKLRNQIRIYVVKSTAVNAFATNAGIILITTGLLAQLESEAQLAFIISHEITHYVKDHALNKYVVSKSISRGKGVYKEFSFNDKMLAENNYSKELETEADLEGFEYYRNTDYSMDEIDGVFDVLQFAYLPFDDIVFDKGFFENEYYIFPNGYMLSEEEATPINVDPEVDDILSTHPSIPKRRDTIAAKIRQVDVPAGNKKFIVSEETFYMVRDYARFELSRIYLTNLYYDAAIYNSYLLLQEYPDNIYLKKIIAKSLVGLTKYSNENDFYDVHIDYDDVEGEQQQLYYLLERLGDTQDELNVLTLSYTWKLRKQYPDNKEIQQLAETALDELVFELDYKLEDFHNEPPEPAKIEVKLDTSVTDSLVVTDTTIDNEKMSITPMELNFDTKSKYEKLREKKKQELAEKEQAYFKYAFVNELDDPEFVELFQNKMKENKKLDREAKKKYSSSRQRQIAKEEAKEQKLIRNKGLALGLDKVVLIDPVYVKLNLKKEDSYLYLKSEAGQVNIKELMTKNAQLAGLNIEMLDSRDLANSNVSDYNDISLLNEWVDEQLTHDEDIDFSAIDLDRRNELKEKYGTKYFMWIGAISVKERSYEMPILIGCSAAVPPLLFALLPRMVNSGNYTFYYYMLYNIETNKMVAGDFISIRQRDHEYVLNMHIYHTFKQIVHKR